MKRLLLATLAISSVFSLNSDLFAANREERSARRADRNAKRRHAEEAELVKQVAPGLADALVDAPAQVEAPVDTPRKKAPRVKGDKPVDAIAEAEALRNQEAAQQAAQLEEAFLLALRARIQERLDGTITRNLEARGVDVRSWLDAKIADAQAAFRRQQDERNIAAQGALALLPQAQLLAGIVQSREAAQQNADLIVKELAIQDSIIVMDEAGSGSVVPKNEHSRELVARIRGELAETQERLGGELVETRERLERELAETRARLEVVQRRDVLGGLYNGLAVARAFFGGLKFW